MSTPKKATELNGTNIGDVISFRYRDGTDIHGILRQIHHDGDSTYLSILDIEYDRNHNYDLPEYDCDHDDIINLER